MVTVGFEPKSKAEFPRFSMVKVFVTDPVPIIFDPKLVLLPVCGLENILLGIDVPFPFISISGSVLEPIPVMLKL